MDIASTVPQGSPLEWGRWLCRRRRLMRVTGRSMVPTLQPGDLLFVKPLRLSERVEENALVVAVHPQQTDLKIIKRVGAIFPDGRYFLTSDNPAEGTDSRSFGALPPSSIVGFVTGYAIQMADRSRP